MSSRSIPTPEEAGIAVEEDIAPILLRERTQESPVHPTPGTDPRHQIVRKSADLAVSRAGASAWRPIGEYYSWYLSRDDVGVALQYLRAVVSVATRDVNGLADEAFVPDTGRVVMFRRGSFVFRVTARELETTRFPQPSAAVVLSRLFLEAADRVLASADAR